ncbi:unnamed protein product [Rotaria sordida]|uniref:Uncharacterized protein n=2 Tax=Rotaria sordida TaxID=392033 RepID=A0A815EHD9_9BILA|nr:unnamed protein product [Rotaria sordida]
MSNKDDESIEMLYSKLCLDLNMDIETKLDAWRSYEHIRKHYVLEGDQLHWLAVSLYLSCRRYKHITTNQFNPISISRLLKSANNLELFIFFDKLHKWEDMANLPDSIRCKIDQVEHAFNISSIIFEKYTKIFIEIFGGNQYKLIYSDYQYKRTSNQINPKLNIKNKLNKCSHQDLYSLIWTIYALAKTIYPSTINDLIASFHLLISSFSFIYYYAKLAKLDYLLKENLNKYSEEENPSRSCKSRFDLSLKLFYYSIENILTIEKKRLISNKFNSEEIQQSFHKLILNNEFIRSLVGLCLLLVLYAHRDKYHDFNWILNIYSLDGYSFLKIIQIFLKTSQQIIKSRSFIKYLSSIEENILSSMAFSNKSLLWNDIQLKGILSYKTISSIQFNLTDKSLSPTNNLTSILIQSPNKTNVSRKLFQSDRSDQSTVRTFFF